MTPLWTILIATCRTDSLTRLADQLMPQAEVFGGEVTVSALWNHGKLRVGEYRQMLLEAADSEYVCFIDDDDGVAVNYCDLIMKALAERPDYVGFTVRIMEGGGLRIISKPAIHSIRYREWSEDQLGWYRHVSHLNPVRRELALHGSFDHLWCEDREWGNAVHPYLKTEQFIDQDMYYYNWNPADSAHRSTIRRSLSPRPVIDYPSFHWHPESLP